MMEVVVHKYSAHDEVVVHKIVHKRHPPSYPIPPFPYNSHHRQLLFKSGLVNILTICLLRHEAAEVVNFLGCFVESLYVFCEEETKV